MWLNILKNIYLTQHILIRWPFIQRVFRGYGTWVIFDIPIVVCSFVAALILRSFTTTVDIATGLLFAILVVMAFIGANSICGVYRRYWSFAAPHDALSLLAAVLLGFLVTLGIDMLFVPRPLPISVVIVGSFFAMWGQLLIRYRRRVLGNARWSLRNSLYRVFSDGMPTLIIGAGEAGQALAYRLQMTPAGRSYYIVGFLDDDPKKISMSIHGLPVFGACDSVLETIKRERVELVVLALHNVSDTRQRELLALCLESDAQVRLLPDTLSVMGNNIQPLLRETSILDILGRPLMQTELANVQTMIQDRVVLVTGACSPVGFELVQRLSGLKPRRIVLLDSDEFGLQELSATLNEPGQRTADNCQLVAVVGDASSKGQVNDIFEKHRPQYVFHLAAYQNTAWMEANSIQAIRMNFLSAVRVLDACCHTGCQQLVLASYSGVTDANSLMGMLARLVENLVGDNQAFANGNAHNCGAVKAVRFGPMLDGRASPLTTIEHQIASGGPVRISNSEIKRTWINTQEAANSLLAIANMGTDGDLFAVHGSTEVSGRDVARRFIRLHGIRPDLDMEVIADESGTDQEAPPEGMLGTEQPGIYYLQNDAPAHPVNIANLVDQVQQYIAQGDQARAVATLRNAMSEAKDDMYLLERVEAL